MLIFYWALNKTSTTLPPPPPPPPPPPTLSPPLPLYHRSIIITRFLHSYSLDKTDFDLQITSLKDEDELLHYITRFTVAIFNTRYRSSPSCLPGVLVAGVTYSVYPGHPNSTTRGEVVMTTVDKDNFEKKLHDWLKDFISCHGNDRLLCKEELNCVKVEFAPVSNHGNSLFTVYVCPTWEVI